VFYCIKPRTPKFRLFSFLNKSLGAFGIQKKVASRWHCGIPGDGRGTVPWGGRGCVGDGRGMPFH